MSVPMQGKVGHIINLNTCYKNSIGKYLVKIPLLTTHNTIHEVWSLDLWNEGTHPYHQATLLVMMICYITFYLSNISFKHYKNIQLWKIHILLMFCSNEMIRVFLKINSIMHIITFISFWKFKIIWTKKIWISLFNNISMAIFLK